MVKYKLLFVLLLEHQLNQLYHLKSYPHLLTFDQLLLLVVVLL